MTKNTTHYNVNPRYTAGSPAMVSSDIALRVAKQEGTSIRAAVDGLYGETQQDRACRLGLRGISEMARAQRKGWKILDLCTGEVYFRPSDIYMRKDGWCLWADLPAWAQDEFVAQKPEANQKRRAWFKLETVLTQWEPEIQRVEDTPYMTGRSN